jgi:hypothetical protein
MGMDSPYRSVDQPHEPDRRAAERKSLLDYRDGAFIDPAEKHRQQDEWERRHRKIPQIGVPRRRLDAMGREIDDEPGADASQREGVADEFAEEFISGTIEASVKRVVEIAADAHGLGLPLRMAEFTFKAVEWCRVAEGDDTLEVSVPIPLGPVELELSAHAANGQDGPPLTVCCAPSDGSAVGVLEIGPFEVGPCTEHDRADSPSGHAGEADVPVNGQPRCLGNEHAAEADAEEWAGSGWDPYGLWDRSSQLRPTLKWGQLPAPLDPHRLASLGVEIISADLSTQERVGSRLEGLVALRRAAQQELPKLRSRLRARGTRLAVLYDLETGRVLWLRLDEDGDSSLPIWRIRTEVDPATGRLNKPELRQTG